MKNAETLPIFINENTETPLSTAAQTSLQWKLWTQLPNKMTLEMLKDHYHLKTHTEAIG